MTIPKIIKARYIAERLDTKCRWCDGTGFRDSTLERCEPCRGTGGDRWDTQRASRWLQSTGAGVKIGGHWCTTAEKLVEHFPTAFAELSLAKVADGMDADEAHGGERCEKCDTLAELVSELEAQVIDLANRLKKVSGG